MSDILNGIHSLSLSFYNGLRTTTMPVLGCSFLTFFFTVFFINLFIWAVSVLTGGRQNKEEKGGRLDDNNNYIYKR